MARPLLPFGRRQSQGGKKFGPKGTKRYSGIPTRLQMHAANNLGVIMSDDMQKTLKFRSDDLDLLDKYYEKTQYDSLMEWDSAAAQEDYVKIRDRKPRINYNVAKILVDKVASKLVGSSTFPNFIVEDDPEDTKFFRVVQKACGFRRNLYEPVKHTLISGSCFARYYVANGQPMIEWFNAKYCYPQFDAVGELEQLDIKYVYADEADLDAKGNPKQKWFGMSLTKMSDVLYDNPEYRPGVKPDFKVAEQVNHELGWVQGEWFRTNKHKHDPDGDGLFADILDFIDDLNYSLSQSSQAVSYNQEPLLALSGVDEDELDKLVRSSQKALSLGKDGKAEFVQSDMKGIEAAEANRDHNRHKMLDVVRVVLHDPEKVVGSAQSGKALEILYAPLVELIDELRAIMEPMFSNLLLKIAMTLLQYNARGEQTILETPKGFAPTSLDLTVQWPAIFPPTIQDLQQKAQVCQVLSAGMIISRESLTRWIAPDLGIDNVEEELQKISVEPILNPFGGGFTDQGGGNQ